MRCTVYDYVGTDVPQHEMAVNRDLDCWYKSRSLKHDSLLPLSQFFAGFE